MNVLVDAGMAEMLPGRQPAHCAHRGAQDQAPESRRQQTETADVPGRELMNWVVRIGRDTNSR
jgi:hypothetical protein